MAELRDLLEREGRRIARSPDFADRMFERGRRRERVRKVAALAMSAAMFVAILILIRAAAPGDRGSQPVTPAPSPGALAGRYVLSLPADDPDVARLGMAGDYSMTLDRSGHVSLTSPKDFGIPATAITFTVDGDEFTTDLFEGSFCSGPGTYAWFRTEGDLSFVPVDDACPERRALLSTVTWAVDTAPPMTDVLEGDWLATFSCEETVRAVREAPVDSDSIHFWLRVQSQFTPSGDPDEPCAGVTEEIQYLFRFEDGRLLIFDPPSLVEGFDGTYRLDGDTLMLRDGGTRNIIGSYEIAFRIDGDTVTFDLLGRGASDPFFVAAWEPGPFQRQA